MALKYSYCGAQIFEIYGLGTELVDFAFSGSVSKIGGLTFDEVYNTWKVNLCFVRLELCGKIICNRPLTSISYLTGHFCPLNLDGAREASNIKVKLVIFWWAKMVWGFSKHFLSTFLNLFIIIINFLYKLLRSNVITKIV